MSRRKGLVLDANILLRAVFGQRVRELLETYEDEVGFYSPDVCFEDARTEDQDFFGSGVATWTTDRVELYLKGE